MAIAKIKTGDKVKITSGKYKGTVGTVVDVRKKIRKDKSIVTRAVVTEVPSIVKYRKAYKAYNMPGQKYEKPRSVDISNLILVLENGDTSKVKIEERDGKKVRVYKKSGDLVPNNAAVSMKAIKAMVKAESEKEEKKVKKSKSDK